MQRNSPKTHSTFMCRQNICFKKMIFFHFGCMNGISKIYNIILNRFRLIMLSVHYFLFDFVRSMFLNKLVWKMFVINSLKTCDRAQKRFQNKNKSHALMILLLLSPKLLISLMHWIIEQFALNQQILTEYLKENSIKVQFAAQNYQNFCTCSYSFLYFCLMYFDIFEAFPLELRFKSFSNEIRKTPPTFLTECSSVIMQNSMKSNGIWLYVWPVIETFVLSFGGNSDSLNLYFWLKSIFVSRFLTIFLW